MEFAFVVLATGPFLENHYISYRDLLSRPKSDRICAEDLGAAVGPS
jgi:hypothetical protein